eukprot:10092333-Alexandrium_andersonii.AAC.1
MATVCHWAGWPPTGPARKHQVRRVGRCRGAPRPTVDLRRGSDGWLWKPLRPSAVSWPPRRHDSRL